MNVLFAVFSFVFVFVAGVSCMNPSTVYSPFPPPPDRITFGECFKVESISANDLDPEYSYEHICSKNADVSIPGSRIWYLVGRSTLETYPLYKYLIRMQWEIKFMFMNPPEVHLKSKFAKWYAIIIFQSLEQIREFHKIIYEDVSMMKAASINIGELHKIKSDTVGEQIASKVAAEFETFEREFILTLRDHEGKPVLIFPKEKAKITEPEEDCKQLILCIDDTHYICSFYDNDRAKQFSYDFIQERGITKLDLDTIPYTARTYFNNNDIEVSEDE